MSDIATTNIIANIINTTPTFTANIISSGKDGTEIELQTTETYIQWRYVGGSWENLVALVDIKGQDGVDGTDGVGITSVELTSGDHSPGTTDIYTITLTDSSTTTFGVYNGLNGVGVGDMLKATYDTTNNGIVDNAEKVNGKTVETNVPSGAVFTDTVYTHPNHSGDVTSVGDGAQTIANGAVTLAKMANMATSSIIGRKTAGTGVPEVLSKSDVLTILNVADGANNYSLPTATDSVLGGVKIGTGINIVGGVINVNGKADVTTITTDAISTAPTVTLEDNNEYIYSDDAITALDITLDSAYDTGFIASVVLVSSASAPTITLINTGSYTVKTKGDGSWASLVLTPTASKTVTMIFNYDGINMNVYVSEV